MAGKSSRKFFYYIMLAAFVCGFLFLVFNENGLIKYLRLKSQVSEIKEQIRQEELRNQLLQAEIDSLERKDPAKIERLAREKYKMIKKGEKTIQIEEE